MDWNSPATKKHITEAKAQGCKMLGAGKNAQYRTYKLPCGHEQEITIDGVRKGLFKCATCLEEKLKAERKYKLKAESSKLKGQRERLKRIGEYRD